MEKLLHYVWKHKLFPLGEMTTTDGQAVEVIDPGLHNHNSGPDFFNAKLKIGGTTWVGNVELHERATEWFQHGHDKDRNYDNVVLHVVGKADGQALNTRGEPMPQMELQVPADVQKNYDELLQTDSYPPCYKIVPDLPRITVHSWMAALETERLEAKTRAIEQRAAKAGGSWEEAYFVTMSRNFGFGINGDAFEEWAQNVPLQAVAHHRDDLFQVEAIFLGQAGLLEPDSIPEHYRQSAEQEGYFDRMRNEYLYLRHKFSLEPMDFHHWRFLRLRPQNFPHIRISQLANLYHQRRAGLSQLLECGTTKEIEQLLTTSVTPYWETHYTFGSTSCKTAKRLSPTSLNLLMVNTAIPTLFAYGRHASKEALCDRAFTLLEQLRPENNHITRMWRECGLPVLSAGDSQALIQLKKEYCDRRDCLRCRFGYEYLKGRKKE